MARFERDYDRDFGYWRQHHQPPTGGMRSDGWGGNEDWRRFAGEEGWYGEGYEGMPGFGYDAGFGQEREQRGFGWRGRGYGGEFRSRGGPYGGRGWESGYGGREMGYSPGWEDQHNRGFQRGGQGGRVRTRAADIMTDDPETVTPETKIADVAQKMRDLDVGIIPVVDKSETRRLRGVITDRDIAVRAVADGKDGNTPVSECMTRDVRSVNKNDSVHDVMRLMRQDQVRRVPVTDREGRLVGIIAQADLAVDYAGEDRDREIEVQSVVERISEPAEPHRGERMAASGRRSGKKNSNA